MDKAKPSTHVERRTFLLGTAGALAACGTGSSEEPELGVGADGGASDGSGEASGGQGGSGGVQTGTDTGTDSTGDGLNVPAKVTGLQQTGGTSSSITFAWDPAANASSYNVYVDGSFVKNVAGTSTSVTGLAENASFSVEVSGQNEQFEGELSDPVTMTTSAEGQEGDLSVLKAFPTAEGGGALATGGRGGKVIYVTNLDSDGPGSFKDACETEGSRIVIFRVSGTVWQKSTIEIRNNNITVAGQTAPGDGIQIAGKHIPTTAARRHVFYIACNHVIFQYLRLRDGLRTPPEPGANDVISVVGSREDLIFDHCSMSWSHDEIFSQSVNHSLTLQYSIIAECLQGHSCGGLNGVTSIQTENIDYHHNMICHNSHRNFQSGCYSYRFINNIVYNWRKAPCHGFMPEHNGTPRTGHHDFISNIFAPGPATEGGVNRKFSVGYSTDDSTWTGTSTKISDIEGRSGNRVIIYMEDNWNEHYDKNQYDMAVVIRHPNGPSMAEFESGDWRYPDALRRATPLPQATIPVTIVPTGNAGATLESFLLPKLGPHRRLDENGQWVDNRDSLDTRYINEYLTRTGISTGGPASEDDVGGFPTIQEGATPYPCTANDGIADGWKTRNGLDVNLRYADTLLYGDAQIGPEIPGLNGWTYIDLFLAGMDIPS